jgi:hypothetical protein
MTMPLGVTPQAGGIEAPKAKRSWMSIAAVAILAAALAGVGYAVTRTNDAAGGSGSNVTPAKAVTIAPVPPPAPPTSIDSIAKGAAKATAATVNTPAPKVALTHSDSIKIADAIAKRVAAAKLRDSVAKAKLAEETQRKMIDSIIAANSAASAATGPRRIVIAEPQEQRGWPEAALLGRAVSDSLRRMLRSLRGRQYIVVDMDSARSVLARTRDVNEVNRTLNADLLISIRLQALPRDSAILLIQSYDNNAVNPFRTRSIGGRPVPKNEVLTNLDQSLLTILTSLDEQSRAPRRPATPPTPPPTR